MNLSGLTALHGVTAARLPDGLTPAERAEASHLSGAALRSAPAAVQRAAVAEQFEAIILRELLGKTMTSMLGSGGGVSGSIFGGMLTDAFAQQLSAGGGLGLSGLIEKQLTAQIPAKGTTKPTAHP